MALSRSVFGHTLAFWRFWRKLTTYVQQSANIERNAFEPTHNTEFVIGFRSCSMTWLSSQDTGNLEQDATLHVFRDKHFSTVRDEDRLTAGSQDEEKA